MNSVALMRDVYPVGFAIASAVLGGMVGSFLGVVAERVPAMVRRGGMRKPALSVRTVRCASTRWRHGRISAGELAASAGDAASAKPLSRCESFWLSCFRGVFGLTAWCMPDVQALFSLWLLAGFLLPLAMIDWRHQLLPDCLTQPLLWAGLLFARSPTAATRRAARRGGGLYVSLAALLGVSSGYRAGRSGLR
jgi:leader peptidase (prepilin peptidase)/N-methyltransferase